MIQKTIFHETKLINQVFVYGTLLTEMPNHNLIKPFINSIQPGKALGVLYDLIYGYPAMTISPDAGHIQYVYGEVIELIRLTEALKVLDELEDYYGPNHPDNLYDRIVQPIILETGEKISTYLYVWRNESELEKIGERVTSGNWKQFKQFRS